ncbi:unnamed protein product [Acanthosepion pharaonis]|uniref:Uncharacterized protein n=1 Tax=Acanthosepion pharaonis TaxID=158019 RepID=A0A812EI78_ACAPH|nr:unnamed protein product [Sepia pharaonis]
MATDEWGTEHSHKCGNATHKPPSVQRAEHQELVFTAGSHFLVVDEVADILEHVPEQELYTRLKEAILKRTGRSDEELLRELFTHVTRGDRTPSQLLRFMRSRLGKHSMAESILRELWMDKLPTTITQILAPIADNTPLDQIYECSFPAHREARCRRPAVGDGEHGVPAGVDESTRNYAGTITDSAPGQRIARHPANTAPKPSRKTKQPAVDTGAAISVIPPKEQQDRKATPYKLQAANGSTIETYGAKTLTLNIGMRRDFLHGLSPRQTHLSRHNTTGISVTTCHGREYIEILNRYSDLIQPLAGTGPARHQTQHHIKTSGQPTFSHPRRLPPHKLEYAQKEFNNMLQDGFIRPSDSPYASPLHLDYQAAILRDTPPKDELTTPQHCPRRPSLSASTDIQGSTGPRTSLVPFGLPPSCRLET